MAFAIFLSKPNLELLKSASISIVFQFQKLCHY